MARGRRKRKRAGSGTAGKRDPEQRAGLSHALGSGNNAPLRPERQRSDMTKTYGTQQAAAKIGVGFRTLNRWLALGKIKPSTAIKMPDGRTLWLWMDADIARGR